MPRPFLPCPRSLPAGRPSSSLQSIVQSRASSGTWGHACGAFLVAGLFLEAVADEQWCHGSAGARPRIETARPRLVRAQALPDEFENSAAKKAALQRPPTMLWRVVAALFYMVPWIDSISVGRFIYSRFRNLIFIYMMAGGWLEPVQPVCV